MARRKIHLHGWLKKLCPEGLELEAETVVEAVNGVAKLLRIKPHPINGRHMVKVAGFETVESMMEPSTQKDLHIVPVFMGGKNVLTSVIKIVVGAILIVTGVLLGNPYLISFGASLVIGGLINLLFPVKTADDIQSKYLGAPGNTTAIGTRIPLIFGKNVKHFGQIVSYNIDAVQA